MNIDLDDPILEAMLQVIVDAIDADVLPGYIEFYDGVKPAVKGDVVTTQVLLGTTTFSDPSAGIASLVLTFNPIADDLLADATSDLSWARIYDGAGTFVADGECGLVASGLLFEFNQLGIVIGGTIGVTTGTISFGA